MTTELFKTIVKYYVTLAVVRESIRIHFVYRYLAEFPQFSVIKTILYPFPATYVDIYSEFNLNRKDVKSYKQAYKFSHS